MHYLLALMRKKIDTKKISVFKSFVKAINQADISALENLMTEIIRLLILAAKQNLVVKK
jgi:hypothetical protein